MPYFARRFSSSGSLVSILRVTADAKRGHYFAKARVAPLPSTAPLTPLVANNRIPKL
jgi:hypothetical protein